jgi:hypothetical protein
MKDRWRLSDTAEKLQKKKKASSRCTYRLPISNQAIMVDGRSELNDVLSMAYDFGVTGVAAGAYWRNPSFLKCLNS